MSSSAVKVSQISVTVIVLYGLHNAQHVSEIRSMYITDRNVQKGADEHADLRNKAVEPIT